ncbi:MAG: AAA family ATPase [Paraprevotella sp.]|jgi:hypothetical protein|nr:AAA family ATPase [Paraprevotella sp.]MBP3472885.1 AAA family ATPase [Paraprevotella sp.]
MGKQGEYIQRIEIASLWSGRKHVIWNLKRDVNVLSGVNGVGKSTILNKVIHRLVQWSSELERNLPGVTLTFYPEDATSVRYDVIRSFDRPLIQGGLLEKLADARVSTELDWQLYQLQRRYLDYQVNIGNRIIKILTGGGDDAHLKAREEALPKEVFQDRIDELFSETGKRIVRGSNEIFFTQSGEVLSPYQLSSGEKQMLVILLTVLVEDKQPYVLFMDEPEISLHIEWQQRLIALIRELNPQVQIILTTHSPAVIMDGWMDAVTEVSDIVQ